MAPHAVYSHTTAARLWDLPLPLEGEGESVLHVAVPREKRAPEGRGVVGHSLSIQPADVAERGGLRVTSLERTVLDLARTLGDEDLLAVMDNALWRRRSIFERATTGSLTDALARYESRVGRSRVASLIAMSTDHSDSRPESVFRLRFVRAGFPEVEPNRRIYDDTGHFLAMPDLQMHRYRLAFDYEGDIHRVDRKQWRKDLRRVPLLQDHGWHHTRLSGDDLADPRDVLRRTRRHLLERGWTRYLRQSVVLGPRGERVAAVSYAMRAAMRGVRVGGPCVIA